jgi:hypothetical protein
MRSRQLVETPAEPVLGVEQRVAQAVGIERRVAAQPVRWRLVVHEPVGGGAAAHGGAWQQRQDEELSASGYFPEVALRLIAVGEKTGQLEAMLIRVADIFETALQRQLDRITALLTPFLTLAIGLIVGGLIVSVMSALLSINELAIS